SAEHGELAAPLEQQANDLQEVLVPAHRDAILGDAAEPGHHAAVERLAELGAVADRAEGHAAAKRVYAGGGRIERLDLQPIDAERGKRLAARLDHVEFGDFLF